MEELKARKVDLICPPFLSQFKAEEIEHILTPYGENPINDLSTGPPIVKPHQKNEKLTGQRNWNISELQTAQIDVGHGRCLEVIVLMGFPFRRLGSFDKGCFRVS
jgi:hypothetical protein